MSNVARILRIDSSCLARVYHQSATAFHLQGHRLLVIPAKAGIQADDLIVYSGDARRWLTRRVKSSDLVAETNRLDLGFRRDDGVRSIGDFDLHLIAHHEYPVHLNPAPRRATFDCAGFEVEAGAMGAALNRAADDDAVVEGKVAMRARVGDREYLRAEAKDGDATVGDGDGNALLFGKVADGTNHVARHDSAFYRGSDG